MINNGKAKISKNFDGLSIIIPSKKNWFFLLFGTFWMGGWLLGFLFALETLFSEMDSGADLFLFFWLIAWTIGGIAITFFLLWGYFGKEKFITERNEVFFEKTIFGIGKKNRLDISDVKNFRTEFVNERKSWFFRNNNLALYGLGGKIKFDYGFKTYSFGLSVDEAEAEYIVGLLKEQFKEK